MAKLARRDCDDIYDDDDGPAAAGRQDASDGDGDGAGC